MPEVYDVLCIVREWARLYDGGWRPLTSARIERLPGKQSVPIKRPIRPDQSNVGVVGA